MTLNETLLEQVITLMADLGVASRAAMEPHSALDGDLGLGNLAMTHIREACVCRFNVGLTRTDQLLWHTIADVARSVQAARSQVAA